MIRFIKKHSNYFSFLFVVLLGVTAVYMSNVTFAIDNTDGIYYYENIENGDIIDFNTKIKGTIKVHTMYNYSYYSPSYTTSSSAMGWLDVHYCKSIDCLEDEDYDVTKSLFENTYGQSVNHSVLSYEDVFHQKNDKVVAWKVYLVKNDLITSEKIISGTYGYSTYSEQVNLGTYYDVVLVPSESTEKTCSTKDKAEINLYDYKELESASYSSNLTFKNNEYYRYGSSNYSVLEYTFDAKKGDILRFKMLTNKMYINYYLNDDEVDVQIDKNSAENDYVTYNYYYVTIPKDGKYVFAIDLEEDYYERFNYQSYAYIKDFELLSLVVEGNDLGDYKVSEDDYIVKYTDCGNGVEFMEKVEIKEEPTTTVTTTTTKVTTTKKVEEKVENPKTGLKDFLPFFIAAALIAGLFALNYNKIKIFKKI